MVKVKVQCIEKTRDRAGNITQYVMKDENGKIDYLARDQMLKMLKNKNYEVINLQIDAAGRIVDKAMNLEKTAQGNNVQKALELSYKMLAQGKDIGFGSISYNGKTWDLLSEKRINNLLSAGGKKIYPIDFVNTFQNYICKRGGIAPYCLHVKSKDGAVDMFNFCINNSEILLKGFIEEYADGYEKYLKPENYIIEAYRVANINQPVNTYTEPDMRLVGTVDKAMETGKPQLDRNVNNNRLYDYDNFTRKHSYNEFNNQYRKVVKQDNKKNRKGTGFFNKILKGLGIDSSILNMFDM